MRLVEREWGGSWCAVNGITAGVQEIERNREGEDVLMNNMWHNAMIDFVLGLKPSG